MVAASSSSSSSCTSFGSIDDVSVRTNSNVKFVCSYGGRILPRYPDGKLRYVGGETRVLAVDRSIPFSELQVKLGELCGWGRVGLRCQLPTDDLDALVSVTSDEDLANLIEEYDIAARDKPPPLKIRAFLHPTPPSKPSKPLPRPPLKGKSPIRSPPDRCAPPRIPGRLVRSAGDLRFSGHHGTPRGHQFLVHHGNYWQ
ncbi:uncharacterized protein LOC120269972 [Dioscorea cayenensis subsp. rotundata]|uniref:Uncharacterized protein LOC120269972 n=1 Tax=Dioscorea cayennensis subsp. rotundata TaxID=55577 RepID=A0AB40C136_DIOCR|nr:uncharacterized protein LOC120269972 [Dioscorea cayenensis subsp. rotundata]